MPFSSSTSTLAVRCPRCGFSYAREDRNGFVRYALIETGDSWDRELARLMADPDAGMSNSALVTRLGQRYEYIKMRALDAGFWHPTWSPAARERAERDLANYRKRLEFVERLADDGTTARERTEWMAFRRLSPEASRESFRKRYPRTYSYLNRHNRAWLDANAPARRRTNTRGMTVDWAAKDAVLSEGVPAVVAGILGVTGKCRRLTKTSILTWMGTRTLGQRLGDLPRTAALLGRAIESDDEYLRRRLRHYVSKLSGSGTVPTPSRVIQRARRSDRSLEPLRDYVEELLRVSEARVSTFPRDGG